MLRSVLIFYSSRVLLLYNIMFESLEIFRLLFHKGRGFWRAIYQEKSKCTKPSRNMKIYNFKFVNQNILGVVTDIKLWQSIIYIIATRERTIRCRCISYRPITFYHENNLFLYYNLHYLNIQQSIK